MLLVCPSLPMLQGVSIKVCTQQSALEYPAIETGAIQIRMEDFSLRNITFAVGETVSCRKASVALSPRDAHLTLALPRRGITRAVLGTVGRAAASYVNDKHRQWWEGSPCRYQATTFQNFSTVEVLNTICLECPSLFFPINSSQGPPITRRVLTPAWNL